MKRVNKNKRVLFPNIIDGGNAIPLGDNYYFMQGRKHSQGGIDIGANNKNGLEVEDGEVMKVNPKSIKVFSAQPLLNGISPAQRVLNGQNPTDVFNAQENYKDRNNLKDDGSKAQNGTNKIINYDNYLGAVPVEDFNNLYNDDSRILYGIEDNNNDIKLVNKKDLKVPIKTDENGNVGFEANLPEIEITAKKSDKYSTIFKNNFDSDINNDKKIARDIEKRNVDERIHKQFDINSYANFLGVHAIGAALASGIASIPAMGVSAIPKIGGSYLIGKGIEDIENKTIGTNIGNEISNYLIDKNIDPFIANSFKPEYILSSKLANNFYNNTTNFANRIYNAFLRSYTSNIASKVNNQLNNLENISSLPINNRQLFLNISNNNNPHGFTNIKFTGDINKDSEMSKNLVNELLNFYKNIYHDNVHSNMFNHLIINPNDNKYIYTKKLYNLNNLTNKIYANNGHFSIGQLNKNNDKAFKKIIKNAKIKNIHDNKHKYIEEAKKDGKLNTDSIMFNTETLRLDKINNKPNPLQHFVFRGDIGSQPLELLKIEYVDDKVGSYRGHYGRYTEGLSRKHKENGGNYRVNSLLDAIYANAKDEKQYGNPIENYNNTISENEAELLGYKKDYRGHRDDRVKYSNHPSHPSRGTFDKNNNFNLSDRGLDNSNYTLFGLGDGNQDGESVIKYNNSIVLPEITRTPNSVYIDNPYDDIAIKMKCGGRKKAKNGINYVVDSNGKSNVRYVPSTGGRAERSEALKTKKALNGTIVTLKPNDLYVEDPIINVPYLSDRYIRDLTNSSIKAKQYYNNINNNTNTGNTNNNSKSKLDLFNNLNTSDLIEGGINTLGNIGSAIINNSMINSLKAPTMPVPNRAVKLKTNININPQLDKMREDLYNYETNINNNTNSSQLALARNQKARLSNIAGINTLYGHKENMETELINKDRINQQTVANKNIDEYNKWLDTVNNFNNNIADKHSENFVNTIQNEINSINNIFTRAEQRRQYDNNVAAYIASHPNVDPELLKAYGFNGINDELIRRKRIVRNRTNSNNPYLSTKTTDNI